MKFIRRLLAGLLAVALTATALSWVADATIWNTSYLQTTSGRANLSAGLATALPSVVGSYAPDIITKNAIANSLTPSYVGSQLHNLIPAFIDSYRHNGARPNLNLTDIGNQFALLNVPVPASLQPLIDRPVPILPNSLDTPFRTAGQVTSLVHWAGPVAVLVLIVVILVVAARKRWKTLAGGAFTAAILTALSGLLVLLPPRLITAGLNSSVARPIEPAIRQFTDFIARDQLTMLIKYAVGLAVAGILLLLISLIAGLVERLRKPKVTAQPEG